MRVAETSAAFVVWWENPSETYHLEDLGVDGRIILKIYLQEIRKEADVDGIYLGQMMGFC
jgi:hypothetical protein